MMRSDNYEEYRLERNKSSGFLGKSQKALEFADKSEFPDEYYDQAVVYALLAMVEELKEFNRNAMLMRASM